MQNNGKLPTEFVSFSSVTFTPHYCSWEKPESISFLFPTLQLWIKWKRRLSSLSLTSSQSRRGTILNSKLWRQKRVKESVESIHRQSPGGMSLKISPTSAPSVFEILDDNAIMFSLVNVIPWNRPLLFRSIDIWEWMEGRNSSGYDNHFGEMLLMLDTMPRWCFNPVNISTPRGRLFGWILTIDAHQDLYILRPAIADHTASQQMWLQEYQPWANGIFFYLQQNKRQRQTTLQSFNSQAIK